MTATLVVEPRVQAPETITTPTQAMFLGISSSLMILFDKGCFCHIARSTLTLPR